MMVAGQLLSPCGRDTTFARIATLDLTAIVNRLVGAPVRMSHVESCWNGCSKASRTDRIWCNARAVGVMSTQDGGSSLESKTAAGEGDLLIGPYGLHSWFRSDIFAANPRIRPSGASGRIGPPFQLSSTISTSHTW